jgi:hypothetical protein
MSAPIEPDIKPQIYTDETDLIVDYVGTERPSEEFVVGSSALPPDVRRGLPRRLR